MEARTPDGPQADLQLVAHPRAKSKVWKYFGFDADAEGCILHWKRISCRICRAQIAYSGNTSNLSYHLEKNHPAEFCELVRSNTEHMREAFASAVSKLRPEAAPGTRHGPPDPATAVVAAKPGRAVDSGRQRDLTAAVLGLLCHGLFPVSIVDEPTFRALLRVAEPRYELPGREFFAGKAIPERCAAVREAVAQELAEAPWCGVSTDTWRSHGQNRSYVTLAAHFLAAGPGGRLSLGSRCLGTFELPDENRAEAVARLLYEALARWGIAAKVSGATTDAGRDVARACSLLDIAVRVPCLAQALEAAVQRALRLPRLAGLLARCGRLVDYFQQSPAALRLLCEKQRQRGAEPRALRSGRAGHWGGALAMLQRLREQQLAVAGALVEDSSHHHLMLEAAEWSAVDGLVQLLQPFQRVAEALAAGEGPAISAVKPLLHALLTSALAAGDADPEEIGLAKQVIAKELAGAYQEAPAVDMFLNVATFLDPRYKRLPFLSALERQQVENRVTEEAEALLEAAGGCAGRDAEQEEDGPEEDGPAAKRPAPPATHGDGDDTGGGGAVHDMLAAVFGQADAREERRAQVAEELGNFKAQKPLGLRGDPLRWWADRRALFPLLPRLLQKYWCVAATRAPPRRLFTSAAGVVAAKRSRLAPARVDQQVFLYENSRGSGADPELEDEDEGAWGADGEPGDAGFP